jgi:UDP-sugar pyrophosphorylase
MVTETCYLHYYIEYILAVQKKYAPEGLKLPLCIMTSGDTNEKTLKLLQKNNNFGMDKSQITIVQQGQGVPALMDNSAKIALEPEDFRVMTKPHGHGDIHALLYEKEVAAKWQEEGVKWVLFFQDTNGLAFHTLPLMLGVSKKLDLIMNSLAVPRKAKQAIGGIAKLENIETKEVK